jgi:surface protein
MCGTFWRAASFNQPLSSWKVSNVTSMNQMFHGARAFNQNISKWDVSNVEDMLGMFLAAGAFNQPIEMWNVSNVTDMTSMFERAVDFNQPLNGWNVSSVRETGQMFRRAVSFNQPLEDWDTSRVVIMDGMFDEASSFDQPLASWNVTSVTSMERMFAGAEKFNQPIGDWRVRTDCNMEEIFMDAINFKQMDPTFDMKKFGAKDWNKLAKLDTSNIYSLLWRLFDTCAEQKEEVETLKEQQRRDVQNFEAIPVDLDAEKEEQEERAEDIVIGDSVKKEPKEQKKRGRSPTPLDNFSEAGIVTNDPNEVPPSLGAGIRSHEGPTKKRKTGERSEKGWLAEFGIF